jgi:putative sigma-54 modulation protein
VQVKISTRHGHLSEAAQKIIRDKAEKLTHLFERLTMIEVTVDLKNSEVDKKNSKVDKCRVEFVVQAEHKHDLVAREAHADDQTAVDLALDNLLAQLRRYKEKIQDHRRTPHLGDTAGKGPRSDEGPDE